MKPHIFIDIETIPGQKEGVRELVAERVHPPGNMKKAETIEKWEAEQKPALVDEAWIKTAFDGSFGEVISIAWAIDDGPIYCLYRRLGEPERTLLEKSIDSIKVSLQHARREPVWVGHNVAGFDLRFLWQRCVVNGYRPPLRLPYNAKPWSDEIFDTLVEWKGLDKRGGTMSEVCFALGIDGKDGMDGSDVWQYVQDGRYEEIKEYNMADVERTRQIFNRLTFNELNMREAA